MVTLSQLSTNTDTGLATGASPLLQDPPGGSFHSGFQNQLFGLVKSSVFSQNYFNMKNLPCVHIHQCRSYVTTQSLGEGGEESGGVM